MAMKYWHALAVAVFCFSSTAAAESFRWPVAQVGANVYAYVDDSGTNYKCVTSVTPGHHGTDIQVTSVDVYAGAPGWVMRFQDGYANNPTDNGQSNKIDQFAGNGFGNHVALFHGSGFESIYGHLSPGTLTASWGASYACGDYMGTSGNSGFSFAPHLHFEVRSGITAACDPKYADGTYYGGTTVDPYSGKCSQSTSYWADQNTDNPKTTCSSDPAPAGPPPCAPGGGTPYGPDAQVVWYDSYYDETVWDGTEVTAGQTFTKSWWIRNTGLVTWTEGFALHFESGEQMSGPTEVDIAPGETVPPQHVRQFSVSLTAPATAGVHSGAWRMYAKVADPKQNVAVGFFGLPATVKVVSTTFGGASCHSQKRNMNFVDGAYFQADVSDCGLSKCPWFQCQNGVVRCAEPSLSYQTSKSPDPANCPKGYGGGGDPGSPLPPTGAPCDSQTLGQTVPSGDCVQVVYGACGLVTCGWFRCDNGTWLCTDEGACTAATHAHSGCAAPAGTTVCGCSGALDNFCGFPPSTPGCPMTAPGGYCDPDGDGNYNDGDWLQGYKEYQAACNSAPVGGGPSGPCGSTCTQCILGDRPDVVPYYKQNGWDTSCSDLDNIVHDWSGIDPTSFYGLTTGACASACTGSAFCGSGCTQCVFGHRADLIPFYKMNNWAINCGNLDNIIANWCGIDPAGCSAVKTGACVSACK
jgi:hypothetical protein